MTPVNSSAMNVPMEFKNMVNMRFNPKLHDSPAYQDSVHGCWWEEPRYWNKQTASPAEEKMVRVVGSSWGQVHSVKTCGKLFQNHIYPFYKLSI